MQFAQKNFHKKLLGRAGEIKAAKFLRDKGYKILHKNYKTGIGEADIIAKDGEYLVFVEVKTRSGSEYGAPSEAVNYKKRRKYILLAKEYLLKIDSQDALVRFDIIEVENGVVNHIENAFTE